MSAAFAEMIKQLGEKHNLPLKTGFNATRGFFVQLTLNRDQDIDLKSLPGEFLKTVKARSVVSFTTVDLVSNYSNTKINWLVTRSYITLSSRKN